MKYVRVEMRSSRRNKPESEAYMSSVQSSINMKSSKKIFFIIRYVARKAAEADVVASESLNKTRTFTIEFDEHEFFIASPFK